ncbi:MAG: hypothetical protein HKM00_09965 [Gallionella sp.]|jgi:hypothetical protein|nr:hypothetical protein [Gallionella sp.]
MHIKIILAFFLLNVCLVSAQAETITPDQISTVIDTYNTNEARFISSYRGKKFEGQVTLAKVTASSLFENSFIVYFDVNAQENYCDDIQDKHMIKKLSSFDPGQHIFVTGLIEDVAFGQLILKKCAFAAQKPKR